MNFNHHSIQIIAEAKIDAAMRSGEFDDLPGFGKPLQYDPLDYDPNWWTRQKIRREKLERLFETSPKVGRS